MVSVAIVEDDPKDRYVILGCLKKYSEGKDGLEFKTVCFDNAVSFLTNYNPVYDIVFMDIQMPDLNGMDAAVKLREKDTDVLLVFITNMSNFAVRGYSVNATDFIVKPVYHCSFSAVMDKLLRIIKTDLEKVLLKTAEGIKKVPVNSIKYVEIRDHQITYHTTLGDVVVWGSLKEEEAKLPKRSFERCNSCYLVNLKYVDEIQGRFVKVDDIDMPISRAKKQRFIQRLLEYCGDNI